MLMLKICFFVLTELPYNILVKSHNRTERESKGVGRDILIFRTMRTTRKQFPVNWLTSGRLAFTIQAAKARRRQQIKQIGTQCVRVATAFLFALVCEYGAV